jgi:hypothetical protein
LVSLSQFVPLGQAPSAGGLERSYIDEVLQKEEKGKIHLRMNVRKSICGKETFDWV